MWLNGQLTQFSGLESALAWLSVFFFFTKVVTRMDTTKSGHHLLLKYFKQPGADPEFFLGGDALVSCSISTPINHTVFFFAEYQLY